MTTTKQVKQLVQPLLANHADLALVGRMIVVRPVQHLLRGIYIDRTSTADDFFPKWAVYPLFRRDVTFGCNWGDVIYNPLGGRWLAADPGVSAAMCDEIERVALPLLQPVRTIQNFVAFASKERFPWTPLKSYKRTNLFVDLALGNFQSARAVCAYCEEQSKLPTRKFGEWQKELDIYIAEKIHRREDLPSCRSRRQGRHREIAARPRSRRGEKRETRSPVGANAVSDRVRLSVTEVKPKR